MFQVSISTGTCTCNDFEPQKLKGFRYVWERILLMLDWHPKIAMRDDEDEEVEMLAKKYSLWRNMTTPC